MTTTVSSAEELKSNVESGVTIVDFYAEWCGPCKALSPTLDKISEEYTGKVKVIKVNVDSNPEIASSHNVRGIPALFFYKDGEILESATGNVSLDDLKKRVDKLI